MLIKKITTGFVTQVFDTEKKQFVSQDFTAGTEVDYETENGDMLVAGSLSEHNLGPRAEKEVYLPFDMVQPGQSTSCPKCEGKLDGNADNMS